MKHILLKKIDARERKQPKPTEKFHYDVISGYWLSADNASLMIADEAFAMLGSKKRDLETGEDQK